jgi:hypothetical protein
MQLLRTSRMEETVIALDQGFDRVMVRAIHELQNPIRIRIKKLQDIRPFEGRNDPAFDREFARWNEENGTMVNFRHFTKTEPVYDYDAGFICEAPLSLDRLEQLLRGAKSIGVVYRPPVWRAHEELLFAAYPTKEACKRLMQLISRSKPTKEFAAIATACGIPTAGTHALNDTDLARELSLSQLDLGTLRKRALRARDGRKYSQVSQLVPRVEPEDRSLLKIYEFIRNELPAVGFVRLARDNALAKSVRFWKTALRALLRSGCVEQKAKTCFYFLGGLEPDYDKIQAEHDAAAGKFERLRAEIDSMKELK